MRSFTVAFGFQGDLGPWKLLKSSNEHESYGHESFFTKLLFLHPKPRSASFFSAQTSTIPTTISKALSRL